MWTNNTSDWFQQQRERDNENLLRRLRESARSQEVWLGLEPRVIKPLKPVTKVNILLLLCEPL